MTLFWQYLFWISLVVVLIPYVIYPSFILLLEKLRSPRKPAKISEEELPNIDIIFAAYNEEQVLEEKLRSLEALDYPKEKLRIRIGSDASTDRTNDILKEWHEKDDRFQPYLFRRRSGKSQILNFLRDEGESEFLLLTDANIIFEPATLKLLVGRLHCRSKVGAVGANIHYGEFESKGISRQEDTYLKLENRIKFAEAKVAAAPLGLEGGCYLIRRELFPEIPPLFYMEDFFTTLHVIKSGWCILWEPRAKVWEDVSVSPDEEYKRKVRIGIGNFQNLRYYGGFLFRRFWPKGLMFLSHKVLRWLSPFFLLILLISAPQLIFVHWFYGFIAGLYMTFIGLGLFGILLSQKRKSAWFLYPGHFINMNLALMEGFLNYLKGIKTNAWQPTQRKQA